MKLINQKLDLAKPTGVVYVNHSTNVSYLSTDFLNHNLIKLFPDIDVYKFHREITQNGIVHDWGKQDPRWQEPCQKDYEIYVKYFDKTKNFDEQCEEYKMNFGKNIMKAHIRHEFVTCIHYNEYISDEQLVAIISHHGKFRNISDSESRFNEIPKLENCKPEDSKILPRVQKLIDSAFELNTFELFKFIYRFNIQRAILQYADRKSSYFEVDPSFEKKLKLEPFNYIFPHKKKNKIQNSMSNSKYMNYDLLIIKARPGGGKSDAALLWAKNHIKNKNADKVIFTLPTIFTSNTLGKSQGGRSINSSTKHELRKNVEFSDNNFRNFEIYQRRNLFYSEIYTTIDRILDILIQKNEEAHTAFFNFANSCLVIDEIDCYDDLVLSNIKMVLTKCYALKIPVLMMSASFPKSYRKFFLDIAPDYKVTNIINDNTNDNIVKYNIVGITNIDRNNIKLNKRIISRVKKQNKKIIIYTNSIKSTKCYYKNLIDNGISEILIHHSHFTSTDKQEKEQIILDNFGKNATKNDFRILIITQIGEMSLDISCDYLISEICPIDRLIQRFGRCGRFDDNIHQIDILIPHDKKDVVYPSPYGTPPHKRGGYWKENEYFKKTREEIKIGLYSNNQLQFINNKIYKDGVVLGKDTPNNYKKYEETIRQNAIQLPKNTFDFEEMEEEGVTQWKRRRFQSTINIFIEPFQNMTISHSFFNYSFVTKTIRIYTYNIPKLKESAIINEQLLNVKDDKTGEEREIKIYHLNNPLDYDKTFGFIF